MNSTTSKGIFSSVYLYEAKYEFLSIFRQPGFTWPTLAFPILFYLFFGLAFRMGGDWNQAAYLMATYATFGVIGPALFGFGVGLATERAEGWLLLKQASPMPISAYFFAKVVMSMIFAFLVLACLFLMGGLFGGVSLSGGQWLSMGFLLMIGTLPFCALGLCVGCWVRASAAVAIVNLIYLPMGLLSGLWIPIVIFPEGLKMLAQIFPAYHLAQLALGLMAMDAGGSVVLHGFVLVGQTFVFLGLALSGFRRRQS